MPTNAKTVFIVGAGASCEFGLPAGEELKTKISKLCGEYPKESLNTTDETLRKAIEALAKDSSETASRNSKSLLFEKLPIIRDNMPLAPSIDNFLDTHREDRELVNVGKLAIAVAIRKAENASSLFVDKSNMYNRFNPSKMDRNWITELFKVLVSQRNFSDFLEALGSTHFVSFNYDRCIHQFIFNAARQYFNLSDRDSKSVLDQLQVHYPYGSVGSLNLDQFGIDNFGEDIDAKAAAGAVTSLRTFTEGASEGFSAEFRELFSDHTLLVFLGFGFLPLNMKMLFRGGRLPVKSVVATTKGQSEHSAKALREEFKRIFGKSYSNGHWEKLGSLNIHTVNDTCSDLFWQFNRLIYQNLVP
ncbi:hypothetical protein ANTHELSMS3_04532 [Antarctobacter heliothermus]|uniref:SIR2-like domain-containing protein n=1 Tax=Antarctobacter heliothermus TaxID=74033 RepID=A0A222EAZ3_9RHOB|nr:hypothetical protein [Antarctobacter heliothermus]ASP23131.1 hypothetical protein ANTHELSMS3_04532 [Antarctobacter heliothermus]